MEKKNNLTKNVLLTSLAENENFTKKLRQNSMNGEFLDLV